MKKDYRKLIDETTFALLQDAGFNFNVLDYIRSDMIDDVIQEAVVAALTSKSPTCKANNFAAKERLQAKRFETNTLDIDGEYDYDN